MQQFEHDVFISYAHLDNEPLSKGQQGWIEMFHDALRARLGQLIGESPRIWRDKKLGGNDRFDKEITAQLSGTATLVSVLTPRYVVSDYCKLELDTFLQAAERAGGVDVGNKSRLFKIVKTRVDREREPECARGLLGYPFFKEDPESGRTREFNRAFGKDIEPEFWRVLDDLAQDMSKLLGLLRAELATAGAAPEPSGATVYLAETTSDLGDERDQIRRDLEARGHRVLPDHPLPTTGTELEQVIEGYLARCTLSIHPIGAFYGTVPEAYEHSLVEMQSTLATRRSQAGELSRVVWMPPELEPRGDRHAAFVDALNNDPALTARDTVMETTLEELKTVIHDTLATQAAPAAVAAPGTAGLTRVYLIHDECDEEAVRALDDYLYEQGFEVKLPLFEGDEEQLRRDHDAKLDLADAVVIFHGAAPEVWLDAKLLDLARVRDRLRTSAVYVAAPETRDKARFRTREVDEVIKAFAAFEPESLRPLLDRLGVTDQARV